MTEEQLRAQGFEPTERFYGSRDTNPVWRYWESDTERILVEEGEELTIKVRLKKE